MLTPARARLGVWECFRAVMSGSSGDAQLLVVALSHGGDRSLNVSRDLANPGPAGGGQHQDRDASALQVLLVAEVGVGGDQELIALKLRQADQVPVGDGGPTQFVGRGHDVAGECAA